MATDDTDDPNALRPYEVVCPVHHTTYHRALGDCPQADEHAYLESLR